VTTKETGERTIDLVRVSEIRSVGTAANNNQFPRLGRILERVEQAGVWEDTAFFLVADHGMEESDPAVRGDWDVALAEAEVVVRDEGSVFLYLSGA
jgi:phosphonoacetate hydrolase